MRLSRRKTFQPLADRVTYRRDPSAEFRAPVYASGAQNVTVHPRRTLPSSISSLADADRFVSTDHTSRTIMVYGNLLRAMTIEEDDWIATKALDDAVLVVGDDAVGGSVAARIADRDVRATDTAERPDAVVLAADGSQSIAADVTSSTFPEAIVRLAVVTVPSRPTKSERAVLKAIRERVDTVVLASGCGPDDLTAAVATLVSIVRDPGIVNVDLADVETVFRSVELAALGVGTGPMDRPIRAIRDALGSLPRSIETDGASGMLVDLIGPPEMSVADVNEVVSTIRGRVGPDAHVIWGGAVDAAAAETIEVRLVFAGVENARVAPGDDCPRCGIPLSAYTLDDRTMLSCEACGFAGVSVRLRE